MKIAVVKPDYHIRGGFEIVIERIMADLKERGHQVNYIQVDMTRPDYRLGNLSIPPEVYHSHEEFFRYALSMDKFRRLELKQYDIVVTTQPPSFAVEHKKVVPLFYHHLKIYYELYEVYKDTGIAEGIDHALTRDLIREIDSRFITNDKFYIAGSGHVADRLRLYNGITSPIATFAAGIADDFYDYDGPLSFGDPICVGRHEFPKRPELFIHAMNHVKGLTGRIIGEGGKTDDLRLVDSYLKKLHSNGEDIDDEYLWKTLMFRLEKLKKLSPVTGRTNVIFTGRLTYEKLIEAYAGAMCAVCPAYEEDYGLTAIEAMAFGKPVIVCKDGGGLAEFVRDGENGFVVEPTGEAIAAAINTLKDNPGQLRQMSRNAYECSRQYSWRQGLDHLHGLLLDIHGGNGKADEFV
jgi:glycosyltransferase involved in cell wall biosynthesis